MEISECDNYLITEQKQAIIVGAKQRSALANYIRPKQKFTIRHIQYAPTVKRRETKNIKNTVTFVTFVTLHSLTYLLVNLFTKKNKVTQG